MVVNKRVKIQLNGDLNGRTFLGDKGIANACKHHKRGSALGQPITYNNSKRGVMEMK